MGPGQRGVERQYLLELLLRETVVVSREGFLGALEMLANPVAGGPARNLRPQARDDRHCGCESEYERHR